MKVEARFLETTLKVIPRLEELETARSYVIRNARKWEVDPERTASKFEVAYYRGLLEKAWAEAAFVFT